MLENVILFVFLLGVFFLGVLCITKPNSVADSLRRFYSNYPLVRYAGHRQLIAKPLYIMILGAVFLLIVVFATAFFLY